MITNTLPHQSSFIKRELFEKYGGYSESYKIVSDWEKWIEFIKVHKCTYKHIGILCSVFNTEGISSKNSKLCTEERKFVINKYFTKREIENAEKRKIKYSFWKKLFSLKKDITNSHKIVTFLGLHFKFRRRIKV